MTVVCVCGMGGCSSLDVYFVCVILFVMLQVFACLRSAKALKACGFHIEIGHSSEKEDGLNPKSDLYLAQQRMAAVMWQAAVQIVRFRALSHMHYIGMAPTCFVDLLSKGDKLQTALEHCRTMWAAVQYMEKKGTVTKNLTRCGQTCHGPAMNLSER